MSTQGGSETSLHRNPFRLLGVTTRDDRQRIVEVANEKLLELDEALCRKARSDLTNPRNRLAVEMAWLPGVAPGKAFDLSDQVLRDPRSVRQEKGLPKLAQSNLLSAAFEAVGAADPDDVANSILQLARVVDELSAEEVLRDINEDRAVSAFPEVQTLTLVEGELAERKRHYRNTVKTALDRLPAPALVEAMTRVAEYSTGNGQYHAPELVDELVDTYRVEAQDFLQKEASNVQALIEAARHAAASAERDVKPVVEKLEKVAQNWDRVAQPIQLSFKARGKDHPASNEMARVIRDLAVDLFNKHDLVKEAQRLTELVQTVFAEVPEVAERAEKDIDTLQDILHSRKKDEFRRSQWAQDITYSAEIGTLFKKVLSISPEGVSWKNKYYPLDSVTRTRWGGIRHSVVGIPTGTTYTIAFGDSRSEAVVELKRREIYSEFVDKLFRAVGPRLLTQLLTNLKRGQVRFGAAIVGDAGVDLPRIWGGSDRVHCTWHQTEVRSARGCFFIVAKDVNQMAFAEFSYIDTPNTHILEHAIRTAFKRGVPRLSDLLEG